jgi:hypothetical protein
MYFIEDFFKLEPWVLIWGEGHEQSTVMSRAYCVSFELFMVMVVPAVVFWVVTHVVLYYGAPNFSRMSSINVELGYSI